MLNPSYKFGSGMVKSRNKAPDRADRLFKNLFADCQPDESFRRIAEGISGSSRNAARLLSDVKLLVEKGHFSSARFLLTTAREEIAKSYILVDMCRLNLSKYDSLRKLCRAFYNHIYKYSYLRVLELPELNSMSDVKKIWKIETKLYWPADPEDGEPDMPHDTVFDRELPLYMDYDDSIDGWFVPADSEQAGHFEVMFHETSVSRTEKLIRPWREANSIGLCAPKVLEILNIVFRKHYIGDDATSTQLDSLYGQVANSVVAKTNIVREKFIDSPLVVWPLYDLV